MNGGELTICLRCTDLEKARRFYETLGLEVVDATATRLVMKNGNTRLALMSFLEHNCLNFRGADAFELYEAFIDANPDLKLEGKPERYKAQQYDATADGTCWSTFDPDGNNVFIDTNQAESSDEGRQTRLSTFLTDVLQDLENLGASDDCIQAFKQEILQPFG